VATIFRPDGRRLAWSYDDLKVFISIARCDANDNLCAADRVDIFSFSVPNSTVICRHTYV
jgi:hypothetical protein